MKTQTAGRRLQPFDCGHDVEALHDSGRGSGGGRGAGYSKMVGASTAEAVRRESKAFWTVWLVVVCLTFPTLVFVSGAYRPPLAYITSVFVQSDRPSQQHQRPVTDGSRDAGFYGPGDTARDYKYLGGLLPAEGFDEESCLSRFQSSMYRKPSPHRPSPYLVDRLRRYEALHKRCAPHTAAYNKTLPLLKDGGANNDKAECRYLVWTPFNGLGNNILTLASTFLYALLTGRVMLIDRGRDLADLFCEPFPGVTWLLPPDFPISNFNVYNQKNHQSYGNLLRYHKISYSDKANTGLPSSFIYVHLTDDYDDNDKRFYCEPDQAILDGIPWMVLKSDLYFVPALFLNSRFEPELSRLFTEKEAVFHQLSRYLFHPSNAAWGMITRYYEAYLGRARERLGIQIRVINEKEAPLDLVAEQVIKCTLTEGLLPKVDTGRAVVDSDWNKTEAVLVASLYSRFFDQIKNMYWEHPAAGGTIISVHQPSHEEFQRTGSRTHDLKAWTEIYLLSFTDVLVTSAWSTFGYIAQGLGGIRPWILVHPFGRMPQPVCVRDMSMEPCFLRPPRYDCKACKGFVDPGKLVPYLTHCEDAPWGIKIVDRNQQR